MPDPGAEPVEVVDRRTGAVVRVVSRAEMRARNLPHRSVYVVVITGAGEVVAHRRSDDKDVWPGRWDVAFGGVVGVGEPWREAARRELAEEAGVEVPLDALVPAGVGTYADRDVTVRGRIYRVVHDGPYTCPDGEVVALQPVPLADLPAWLAGRSLCPDSAAMVVPLLTPPRDVPPGPPI